MQGTTTFEQFSKTVAGDFLNSVLLVDDRARLAPQDVVEHPSELKTPGRQGKQAEAPAVAHATNGTHDLYAKPLIDSFAKAGMLCAVFRPEDGELDNFKEKLGPVTECSDVLILDWVMGIYRNGEAAVRIIKDLLKTASRARLIVVYSGESDLLGIAARIRAELRVPVDDGDPFTISTGSARICVYAKNGGTLPEVSRHRSVEQTQLPEVVVDEFFRLTGGLVSNVALKSLGALRNHTHQLLRKFDKSLDPAYVTHKTLLLPEEAAHHLIPLVVSEIQAILEDAEVWEAASSMKVLQWIKHQLEHGLKLPITESLTQETYIQGLNYLLKNGADEAAVKNLFQLHKKFAIATLKSTDYKKAIRHLANALTEILSIQERTSADQSLAVLMSVRSRYGSPAPKLGLGTIVLETRGRHLNYLLCVQPRCDSVRIRSARSFPFLPLDVKTDGGFIVVDGDKLIRLGIRDKPHEARMILFAPARASEREILARRRKNGRFFAATGVKKTSYRWIADLKPDHAQRVANDFAYKISRVGLTESEWLRRLSLKAEQ